MSRTAPFAIRDAARYTVTVAALIAPIVLLAHSLPAFAVEERDLDVPEGSRIMITGTAKAVARNSFRLDYGHRVVLVLIGASERYAQQRNRLDNRTVTVYGRLDREFFDREQLMARVVYVHDLNMTFYGIPGEQDGAERYVQNPAQLPEKGAVGIAAMVAETKDGSITLEAAGRKFVVDTAALADRDHTSTIAQGDLVLVHGRVGKGSLFDNPVVQARSVIVLKEGGKTPPAPGHLNVPREGRGAIR